MGTGLGVGGASAPLYKAGDNIIGSDFQRRIVSGTERVSATIEKMELPFEDKLESYVKADGTSISTIVSDIKTLLSDLKSATFAIADLFLTKSGTVALMDGETDVHKQFKPGMLGGTAMTDDPIAWGGGGSLKSHLESLYPGTEINMTGLDTDLEKAIYNRFRLRVLRDATFKKRLITQDISKRLPYAGMEADLLLESANDQLDRMTEGSYQAFELQMKTTYQLYRDRFREGMELSQLFLNDYHELYRRKLAVYSTSDEKTLLNHYQYYDAIIKRALGQAQAGMDFALKAASGPDQITFENYLKMSKILGDAQLNVSALISNLD